MKEQLVSSKKSKSRSFFSRSGNSWFPKSRTAPYFFFIPNSPFRYSCHFSRKANTGRNSPCPIKKTQSKSSEFLLVRIRGFEPPWSCPHTDLNRARLPIPPYPQDFCFPWRDYFIIHRFTIFASFFWNFSWFFSIFFLLFSEPLYFARLWVSLPNDSELSIYSRFHRHVFGFKTTRIQSEIFNTDTYTLRSNFLSEYHPPC